VPLRARVLVGCLLLTLPLQETGSESSRVQHQDAFSPGCLPSTRFGTLSTYLQITRFQKRYATSVPPARFSCSNARCGTGSRTPPTWAPAVSSSVSGGREANFLASSRPSVGRSQKPTPRAPPHASIGWARASLLHQCKIRVVRLRHEPSDWCAPA
jgi:hypothetical protein